MKDLKKISLPLLLVGFALVLGSCGLFRKKNKCNTCPHFNDEPAAHQSMESTDNQE